MDHQYDSYPPPPRPAPPLRSGPAFLDPTAIFLVLFTLFIFFLPLFVLFPPIPPSQRDALEDTHTKAGLGPAATGSSSSESTTTATKTTTKKGNEEKEAKIKSLCIYPIKSCQGIKLSQSKVFATGLEFDRLYTFAQLKEDAKPGPGEEPGRGRKWEFITQRQFPLLATVQVDLYLPDIIKARGRPFKDSDAYLLVRFPWHAQSSLLGWIVAKLRGGRTAVPEKQFVLPVMFPSEDLIRRAGYRFEDVTIWRDTVTALNMGVDLPRELAAYLGVGKELGIFRSDPARLRPVFKCAPSKEEAGYQPRAAFQDSYPLHLQNLASIRHLEKLIDLDEELKGLDPSRFRANILVDGDLEPYDEESWKKIRFEPGPGNKSRPASTFHVSCRTTRCKLPNVNQETGSRHPVEPDSSLRKHRDVDEGAKGKGCLGMQMTPLFDKTETEDDLESWLEVGMSLKVLERGEHIWLK